MTALHVETLGSWLPLEHPAKTVQMDVQADQALLGNNYLNVYAQMGEGH